MGFMNTPSGGGDFDIFVKYNAKAGRWYTKEDKPESEEYEVENLTAIFDFENLRTGWFEFSAGAAPVKTYDPSLSEATPKPNDGAKRGFEIRLFSEKNLGGVREFASTAGAVIDKMNGLYDEWVTGKDANAGKLPVVKCVGVEPITNKHGTNYAPKFEIVAWKERPDELADGPKAEPEAANPRQHPEGNHTPPPAAAPAAAPQDDDVDF